MGVSGRWTAVPARAWCDLFFVLDKWYISFKGVVFGDGLGSVVLLDGACSWLLPVGRQ